MHGFILVPKAWPFKDRAAHFRLDLKPGPASSFLSMMACFL